MGKLFLFVAILMVGTFAYAYSSTLTWGKIVRNHDGSVRGMTQNDASQYCQKAGGRLPTAREFAELAVSMGADGIRETAFPDISIQDGRVYKEMYLRDASGGFHPIYRLNPASQLSIDFYYNYVGYTKPKSDFGNYVFWSSTVDVHLKDNVYAFSGRDGIIMSDIPNAPEAVRCVF